ncbi:MAG TPA: hypothetical protein VMV69_27490 [Pirellulales bacterium]|nr:hypothetical protein [Pirellulales bacterium]
MNEAIQLIDKYLTQEMVGPAREILRDLRGDLLTRMAEKPVVGQRRGPTAFWWMVHNLVSHPLSEVVFWFGGRKLADRVHDWSVPRHRPGAGRG